MNKGRLDDCARVIRRRPTPCPGLRAGAGHLAVIEAELGETESALARLYSLAASSDDPEHAAQLARILKDAGCAQARHWSQLAAARYDELVATHPEAFADHAAEFWLAAALIRTRHSGWRE